MPCFQELQCERRCQRQRACGRHACKRRCCDGDCPPCPESCGRRLRCGNHKCPAPCHEGPCAPCPVTVRIACACGGTAIAVRASERGGFQCFYFLRFGLEPSAVQKPEVRRALPRGAVRAVLRTRAERVRMRRNGNRGRVIGQSGNVITLL